MARYDGSIKFDTKIDEEGFNEGVDNLGEKSKGLFAAIGTGLAGAFATGITAAVVIGKAISVIVGKIKSFINGLVSGVKKLVDIGAKTEALKAEFANLKLSVSNAFLPLLNIALPILQKVAAWLTKIFNIIGMVIGALTGQSTVMRAVADAAGSAAGSTGKMAENSEDAEKAAKGALAAFDDINVLQMEEPQTETDTGGGGGGTGFELVPISEKIMEWAEKVRAFLEPLKQPLKDLWQGFKDLASVVSDALMPLWDELGISAGGVLEWMRDLAINGIEWLTLKIQELTTWIEENPEEFRKWVKALIVVGGLLVALFITPLIFGFALINVAIGLLIALFVGFVALVKWIIGIDWKGMGQSISSWGTTAWTSIQGFFINLWNGVKTTFTNIMNWINTNVIGPIGKWFDNVWKGIGLGFSALWGGIVLAFKVHANLLITALNYLIRGVVAGLNVIIGALNSIQISVPDLPIFGAYAGTDFGFNFSKITAPQIPKLATGAVIPPNSQFLAVLGDQRSGNNIEAPEKLIRKIIQDEMKGYSQEDLTITIPVLLDGEKIYENQKKIQRRHGTSLVTGGIS